MKKFFLFVLLSFIILSLVSCDLSKQKERDIWYDYAKSTSASEEFKNLYSDADKTEVITIYSYDSLDTTSFRACIFYKQAEVIGVKVMRVEYLEGGNAVITEVKTDSSDTLFNEIKRCIELFPDFKIMGLRAAATPTKLESDTVFSPFGINGKDEYVSEYDTLYGELQDFPLVSKPFKTVNEGRNLLDEYWQKREQIENSIERFGVCDNPRGYYLVYGNIDNYDNIIACPLISDSGGCIAHLLYLRNKLVAEIVIKEAGDGYEELLHRGDKKSEESGEYPDLGESLYMGAINEFKAKNPDTDIKGVSFDGEKYTVVS